MCALHSRMHLVRHMALAIRRRRFDRSWDSRLLARRVYCGLGSRVVYDIAPPSLAVFFFFFLNDTAPPKLSPLPLHAPLPICCTQSPPPRPVAPASPPQSPPLPPVATTLPRTRPPCAAPIPRVGCAARLRPPAAIRRPVCR